MNLKRFIRKLKCGKPIIVVSGLPRSGTSMLMKMLDASGINIISDGQRTSDVDNPKGYYEIERIKELDKDPDKTWLADLRGSAVKIISFLLKDLPDTNNYQVLFMKRDLREVIASQNKMLVHRGEPVNTENDDKMIRNFEIHLQKTEDLLRDEPKFSVLYMNHRAVLNNPLEEAEKICRFLGINDKAETMAGIVDTKLYRNRA